MKKLYSRFIQSLCQYSLRYPLAVLLIMLIPTLWAISQFKFLQLDTNLIRLLPVHSRSAKLTRQLDGVVGGGGYFTIMFEGKDREKLVHAILESVERIQRIEGVYSVEFRHPIEFYKTYSYLLIPQDYLEKILDLFIRWEAEVNPLTVDLMEEEASEDDYETRESKKDIERLMEQYSTLADFHQSKDGLVMGMIIYADRSVTRLGEIKNLYQRLEEFIGDAANEYNIWTGIGGTLRNKINEYDLILSDLRRSGIITFAAIIGILILGFHSIRILPILFGPLLLGLIWTLGLIPNLVGALNTIAAFMLLVSFGLGIDFSIHLVKRFQKEVGVSGVQDALISTYSSTGKSVLVSSLTTSMALFILAVSDFKGFSEFGLVGGASLLLILLAMFLAMPAFLVLGQRFRLITKGQRRPLSLPVAGPILTRCLLAIAVVSLLLSPLVTEFDYDFRNLKSQIPESSKAKERQYKVYPSSMSPAAVYVAKDLEALDLTLKALYRQKEEHEKSRIGWIRSVRDLFPDNEGKTARLELIAEIQEQVQGRWVDRMEDPDKRQWIKNLRDWSPPDMPLEMDSIPDTLLRSFQAKDDSGRFLIAIYPNGERKNGKISMAFTRELFDLQLHPDLSGPLGETPVFAEILWLVTSEGPRLTLFALLGIFALVFLNQLSLRGTAWIMMPLLAGMALTFGLMAVLNFKLNFFNIVVIPSLLGMGVDAGVHYYRRWQELGKDTHGTQRELFGPLTVATVTTMCGYSGMIFARHPGLHSIGLLACLGLGCTWVTSLVLLPGVLEWWRKRGKESQL